MDPVLINQDFMFKKITGLCLRSGGVAAKELHGPFNMQVDSGRGFVGLIIGWLLFEDMLECAFAKMFTLHFAISFFSLAK